jgi:hypothetical protein
MAIAKGGTWLDLMETQDCKPSPSAPRWDMEPLETDTIEQTLTAVGLAKSSLAAKDSD